MKENKSKKSLRQHTKSVEKECKFYSDRAMKVVEEKSLCVNIQNYCESNSLTEVRVREVLKSFSTDLITSTDAPKYILDWLLSVQITEDVKRNKVLGAIKDQDFVKYMELRFLNMDSQSILVHFNHSKDKQYLRGMKVKLVHNRNLYKYLVRENLLVDYRRVENHKKANNEN